MTDALESAFLEPPGARTILSLSAPFAAGKSTLVKQWAQTLYLDWTGAAADEVPCWEPAPELIAEHIPVCYLTLLSEARSKDLYTQLLAFLGYPAVGVERALVVRAITALRNHRVRLVILDDAHMLRTSSVTGRATLNAIKHLNTELGELGGILMLVGAELTGGPALSDPQIRGRLSEHTFTPYAIVTDDDRATWQRFLQVCEDRLLPHLPQQKAGLFCRENAAYIWSRTQGFVGDTSRLLIDGTCAAIAAEAALDRSLLDTITLSRRASDAHQLHIAARGKGNNRQQKVRAPKNSPARS